ncbi:hypothetical protein CANCADRAFT_44452 [Tortispora caseinolytica NRRL Y-17796]|uniref:MATE efflux family protein n=1 Tax=Tortispora caseinolytica NRRL Y-17796 TaxID=767744 RepID=A0A1E4TGI6_9ASCO|nr:hypothetical protein CANCADRAFT_44452 [Tortispora caseinolytica NRRL Y-17796]
MDEHSPLIESTSNSIAATPRAFNHTVRRSSIISSSLGSVGQFAQNPLAAGTSEYDANAIAVEERRLLEDNNLLPAPDKRRGSLWKDEQLDLATREEVQRVFEQAAQEGLIHTTHAKEMKVIIMSAIPMVLTFLLQYSLTVASIFSVGHLGKAELGAVSLGSMTASISGYAVCQGLSTCMDTLCAQAYGSKRYDLVGIHLQRCVYMLLLASIPVAFLWFFATPLLNFLVPDAEAELVYYAASYLRILIFGLPGYILFECGKRFTQAQGLFRAGTYSLLITAPTNMLLNYFLVWDKRFGFGFFGAPTAVVISDYLMALLLLLYVRYVDGWKCWNGFSRQAFVNWSPMIKLAIPGFVMVEAEYMAFEILTLASSYLGTSALAANSVASTVGSIAFQSPFALGIATSTRVANFVGSGLKEPGKIACYSGLTLGFFVGVLNAGIITSVRYKIGPLFTNDDDVIAIVGGLLPYIALYQIWDSSSGVLNGILRGQGRQKIGGWISIAGYYVVAIPLSLIFTFPLGLDLKGLWLGVCCGQFVLCVVEAYFIFTSNWDNVIQDAKSRSNADTVSSTSHV